VTDRRLAARFEAPLLAHLSATVRPGNAVRLVNLAEGGALVHSRRPLPPGARIHLQILGGARPVRISGQVLRCGVASLSAADGALYLGALQFDSACELPWPGRTAGRSS
jgi:hypothetical protein